MEYVILTLAVISALIGLLGSVLPVLPGPPVSYVALWIVWLSDNTSFSITTLVVMGLFMIAVTILDYLAPIWMTKIGGGSKMGIRGAMAGLLVGLFLGPFGMIFGPFVGALVGELLSRSGFSQALKSATYSFLSFILTTGLKLIYCIVVIVMIAMHYLSDML